MKVEFQIRELPRNNKARFNLNVARCTIEAGDGLRVQNLAVAMFPCLKSLVKAFCSKRTFSSQDEFVQTLIRELAQTTNESDNQKGEALLPSEP